MSHSHSSVSMDPAVRAEVVAYLREWLPRQALVRYREMIERDPEGWFNDPHFAGGLIVKHALRGNGLDERMLGVESLEAVWIQLLQQAVEEAI